MIYLSKKYLDLWCDLKQCPVLALALSLKRGCCCSLQYHPPPSPTFRIFPRRIYLLLVCIPMYLRKNIVQDVCCRKGWEGVAAKTNIFPYFDFLVLCFCHNVAFVPKILFSESRFVQLLFFICLIFPYSCFLSIYSAQRFGRAAFLRGISCNFNLTPTSLFMYLVFWNPCRSVYEMKLFSIYGCFPSIGSKRSPRGSNHPHGIWCPISCDEPRGRTVAAWRSFISRRT